MPKALAWCQEILALPPVAMAKTRQDTREDLVRIVEEGLANELDNLAHVWFSEETQTVLRAIVERLTAKKG